MTNASEPKKLKTVNLQGKEYAQVAERLRQFREDFPNSKILPKNTISETGDKEFTTYIWKDRATYISGDLNSADAAGTSWGQPKNPKDREKFETVSIGRALAILGYLASGEVASFEEMEDYYKEKEAQRVAYIQEQVDLLDNAKTLEELKEIWGNTNKIEPDILAAKDKRKAELEARDNKQAPKTKLKSGPIATADRKKGARRVATQAVLIDEEKTDASN